MTEQQPQNPVPGPARETFHQEFFRRAEQFSRDMLTLVPELEAIAITPSWEVPQDRLPYGTIVGRNGPISTPVEVIHMAEQLHGTLKIVMDRSYQTLRGIDKRMAEMAEELRVKQQQLDGTNHGDTPEADDPAGGGAPGSPG